MKILYYIVTQNILNGNQRSNRSGTTISSNGNPKNMVMEILVDYGLITINRWCFQVARAIRTDLATWCVFSFNSLPLLMVEIFRHSSI